MRFPTLLKSATELRVPSNDHAAELWSLLLVCENKQQKRSIREMYFSSGNVSIKTLNVWHAGSRAITMKDTPLTCMCLNMYTKYTHKPHSHRCGVTNTCIMDGGHYQCVLSMPAVYSWDKIADSITIPLSTQTQQWLSHFECLKRHKEHLISFIWLVLCWRLFKGLAR